MEGRREWAIGGDVLGVVVDEEGGPRRERSSMKFPVMRLEGVRGRWSVRVIS